jgi:hypothetical protein
MSLEEFSFLFIHLRVSEIGISCCVCVSAFVLSWFRCVPFALLLDVLVCYATPTLILIVGVTDGCCQCICKRSRGEKILYVYLQTIL